MYRIAIISALLLSACGDNQSANKPAAKQIFKEEQAALAKAKTVEKTVQDSAEAQKQQIEADSGK